jgi:serine/threonine protein kinase
VTGQVKILDFGLAKVLGRPAEALTDSHSPIGTCDYIAPEQRSEARDVDERADVCSVAVVMFWLGIITGLSALGLILLQQGDVRRAREVFFPETAGDDVDRTARLVLSERRGEFFAAHLTTVSSSPQSVEAHVASRFSADYSWYYLYAPLAVAHDFYEEKGRR